MTRRVAKRAHATSDALGSIVRTILLLIPILSITTILMLPWPAKPLPAAASSRRHCPFFVDISRHIPTKSSALFVADSYEIADVMGRAHPEPVARRCIAQGADRHSARAESNETGKSANGAPSAEDVGRNR